jgi:hypothetical protein
MPGLRATVRMEGDTFEMEDHRNWTDASFKTYVRPLVLPWPYTLKAGEEVKQSIKVKLSGSASGGTKAAAGKSIVVKLGLASRDTLQPLGLGMPAEEIEHAVNQLGLLKLAAPRFLVCHFDPRQKHGLKELYGYRVLSEQTGAEAVLEIVVESVDDYKNELRRLADMVKQSGFKLAAIELVPVGDLKSVLPGGPRPPAPPLDDLYAAARTAFPGIRLGGGMFSFFTELNRKRVPAQRLDFVHNTTCPIVHAADDRSVMETLEALPYQVTTARSFFGKTPYRIGPSGIGCRDNPHGATWTPNPENVRVCLTSLSRASGTIRRGLDPGLHRHIRPHRHRSHFHGGANRAARHRLPQGATQAAVVRRTLRPGRVPGVSRDQRYYPRRGAEAGRSNLIRQPESGMPGLPRQGRHHAVAGQPHCRRAEGADRRCEGHGVQLDARRGQFRGRDHRSAQFPEIVEADE